MGDPLTAEQVKALVIVKGDYSAGTGFVAKMHGQFFIITNQHVLSGNKKFSMTSMDGTPYPTTGAMYGAKDYDVAMVQIPESAAKYYLEIEDDDQNHTKADEFVTVPGNADGTGVPVQIHGRLVGIGPDKVEVTAMFIHGNSGSPIIYRPTGKVIGIATEVRITSMDELKTAAHADSHHWLGYRLDNIPAATGWVKMDWAQFSDQGLKIQKIEDVAEFMIELLDKPTAINHSDDPQIQAAIDTYKKNSADALTADGHLANEKDAEDYVRALKNFVNQIHSLATDNMKSLSYQSLYPYHATRLKEQQELWAELDKPIADLNKKTTDLMMKIMNYQLK